MLGEIAVRVQKGAWAGWIVYDVTLVPLYIVMTSPLVVDTQTRPVLSQNISVIGSFATCGGVGQGFHRW